MELEVQLKRARTSQYWVLQTFHGSWMKRLEDVWKREYVLRISLFLFVYILLDIPLPDAPARKELFNINLRGINVDPSVNIDELVVKSEGYSCADITSVRLEWSDLKFMFYLDL
jgi:hypothetical protein